MRTMRKICRKRMLRRADVAKMLPCVPAAITASDATNTIKSVIKTSGEEEEKTVTCESGLCNCECEEEEEEARTYDTEGLPGKPQPSLPSSISAATAGCPDPDEVLQSKHDNHHKLLENRVSTHTHMCNSHVKKKSV